MLELDQKPVPSPVLQAFQDSLDTLPAKPLLEFARTRPDLMKGLSPRPESAPALRTRLKALLAARRQPDPTLLDLLRESTLFSSLVMVLSETALAHGFPTFCAYFGEARFLAALLLDSRETIRTLAWSHLETHPAADAFQGQSPETARATLESDFAPFLAHLADVRLPRAAAAPAADPAELQALKNQLRQAEEQARRETRNADKEKRAHAHDQEQHRLKIESLESRLRTQSAQAADAVARAQAAARTLEETQDDLHRRIREGVAAELESETRRWLLPLRAMEQAARSRQPSASLLGEVKETLRQQAERDRAAGTRHTLRQRLDALRQARNEIRDALQQALNRHPRLPELADALDREIDALAELLGEPVPAGSAENALLAQINGAPSVEALNALRAFLDGPAATFALFPPTVTRELQQRLESQRARLLQALIPPGPASHARPPADRLRHALALPAVRLLLLVDGHNLLLSRPELFQRHLEADGQPGARARAALADRLAERLTESRDCDVRLYFDGPERSETDRTPRLKVIYSGGGAAEQRADTALVDDLAFFASRYEGCFVVTDDAGLLARAERPGVHGRSLNQLAAALED